MNRRLFTKAEDQLLRERFADSTARQIGQQLQRSICSVRNRFHKLGLRLTNAQRRERAKLGGSIGAQHPSAIAHRIPKGNRPLNKGLRRPGYSIGRGRMRETQFKKGQRSKNWLPVGSIKTVDGYLYLKISDAPEPPDKKGGSSPNWISLQHKVWEDADNPPVNRRTHVLIFRDGDRKNCALENLELITRAENCRRNSIHRLPPKLKKVIVLKGAIKRRIVIYERSKRNGNETQHSRRSA